MSMSPLKLIVALLISVLIIAAPICDAKRALGGSSRKTSGSGYSNRRQPTSVTKPTHNTNSGSSSNSHADAAKLSYPNYNSQPNRPANSPTSNNQPIGWNVPNQGVGGPPPAYSASNVAGGAKTNIHEPPPVYQKPNYGAAPPSYNQATGTNYGQYHNPGALPAGATYHSPSNLPHGATYYNNPSQVPGGYPASGYPSAGYGGSYHAPAGASYYPSQGVPQGATYLPAGNALPPGAVYYSSPPQQTSSGLGFGSGLAAGALGGALLGHVLTPSQTRVVEHAPAAGGATSDSGHDRIIIINNGQVMNTTDANGVTVINTGDSANPAAAANGGETSAHLAPMAPMPVASGNMPNNPAEMINPALAPVVGDNSTASANSAQPPAGGIICVPIRVNITDPSDSTKIIEQEQTACYPAPPPQPQLNAADPAAVDPVEGSAPLAPMQTVAAGSSSQQLQRESTLIGDQSIKSAENAAQPKERGFFGMIMCLILSYLVAYN